MRRLLAAVCGLLALATAGLAHAADPWPNRFVTVIVPFAAGSGSDTAARIIGQFLGPKLGQNIVVENRVGATGAIAWRKSGAGAQDVAADLAAPGPTKVRTGGGAALVEEP